jgi:hypothetical protein
MNTYRNAAPLAAVVVGAFFASASALAQDAAPNGPSATKVAKADDNKALAAAVEANLQIAPEASGLNVNVGARNGVVTLSGLVASELDSTSAEMVARTTDGVTDVDNRIIVREDAHEDTALRTPANRSLLPRTSPAPATPGAPGMPNGLPAPLAPTR